MSLSYVLSSLSVDQFPPKSPPQHISSLRRKAEGELLNVYVLEGQGEVLLTGQKMVGPGEDVWESVPSHVFSATYVWSQPHEGTHLSCI